LGRFTYDPRHEGLPIEPSIMKAVPRWVLAVTIAGGALGGCQREPRPPTADFFPLHADDTWVYEVTRPLRNERTRLTVRARGDRFVTVLNRHCHVVEESYAADANNGGRPETYPIAYYRENGFLYRSMSLEYRDGELHDVGLGTTEERFLPDALRADSAWDSVTTAYDLGARDRYGVKQRHRAVLDPQTITVPAGNFANCVRVDTVATQQSEPGEGRPDRPLTLYYSDWYAPNVGLVRTVQSSHAEGGPALARIELVAYDVAGAR
jgi:hypothetical protein